MKRLLIVLAGIMPVILWAGEIREHPVYQLTNAPVIDGNLDEAAWAGIPEAGGFYMLGKSKGYALVKPTRFKAGWTKEGLFLGVRCVEPAPDKIKALQGDGGNLWEDDGMELFFCPTNASSYVQLTVNTRGSRWNGTSSGSQALWEWVAKAQVGKEAWTLEVKIPFKVSGNTPNNGDKWRVNIGRNTLTGPEEERFTSWPDLSGGSQGFHSIAQFGVFVFKGNEMPAGEKDRIEREIRHGSKHGYRLVGPSLANGRIEDLPAVLCTALQAGGHATSAAPTIGIRNQTKLNHAKIQVVTK